MSETRADGVTVPPDTKNVERCMKMADTVELSWSDADALRMMLDRAIREDADAESSADVIAASELLERLTLAIHVAEAEVDG